MQLTNEQYALIGFLIVSNLGVLMGALKQMLSNAREAGIQIEWRKNTDMRLTKIETDINQAFTKLRER